MRLDVVLLKCMKTADPRSRIIGGEMDEERCQSLARPNGGKARKLEIIHGELIGGKDGANAEALESGRGTDSTTKGVEEGARTMSDVFDLQSLDTCKEESEHGQKRRHHSKRG